MSETLEHTARRIAEHGREALLARLRPAFEEAAAAHRDALQLDDEQLEQMIQRAADRADGLQWRRALASVATEQLGIGLGEALGHPAVVRAQAIVGAPSYEDALNELRAGAPAPAPAVAPKPNAEPESAAEAPDDYVQEPQQNEQEPEEHEPEEHEPERAPAPEADAQATEEPDDHEDEEYEDEDEGDEQPVDATAEHEAVAAPGAPQTEPEEEPDGVRLRAVHLGGIANLAPGEGELELHISSFGLDIIRGAEQSVLGRLTWDEIVALEAPEIGGRFRRKRQADAHLVVRSQQGSASFEIPGVTTEELHEHIDPLLARR